MRLKVILFYLIILSLTACIQTSSEPEIVSTQRISAPPTATITNTTSVPTDTAILPTLSPSDATIPDTFSVQGQIINQSTGNAVAEGTSIAVQFITSFPDNAITSFSAITTTTNGGVFTFTEISTDIGVMSFTVDFDGQQQRHAVPINTTMIEPDRPLIVDIPVYVHAADTDDIVIEAMEFTVTPLATERRILVSQVIDIVNTGNERIALADGNFVINLPTNAQNPQLVIPPALSLRPSILATALENLDEPFQSSAIASLDTTTDTPRYVGQIPFLPGEDNRLFFLINYELPYLGNTLIAQDIAHPVETATVFIPRDETIDLQSNQLSSVANVQRDELDGYLITQTLQPNDVLRFTIAQDATLFIQSSNRNNTASTTDNDDLLNTLILLTGLSLIALSAVYLMIDIQRRAKRRVYLQNAEYENQRFILLDEIVALDERFERGEIERNDYEQQRNRLKALLYELNQNIDLRA